MSDILKLIIDMMFLSVKIIVLEITERKKVFCKLCSVRPHNDRMGGLYTITP